MVFTGRACAKRARLPLFTELPLRRDLRNSLHIPREGCRRRQPGVGILVVDAAPLGQLHTAEQIGFRV